MKQWLSKFRSQRLRGRFKDGVGHSQDDDGGWWNQPAFSLLIGFSVWCVACVLLHAGMAARSGTLKLTLAAAGNQFLLLVITAVCGMLLRVLTPATLAHNARLLLLSLCALATVIPGSLIIHEAGRWTLLPMAAVVMLIPFALSPLLAGALLGGSAAVVAGLWSTLVCLIIGNYSIPILLAGLVATAMAARITRLLRRRTQLIRAGLAIGLVQLVCLIVPMPGDALTASELVLACVCSGLGAALLTLLLLPVCESLSGLTSNMTLLELSDLGHPLLQRLAFEAPGTYHHSLTLANLAAAAADAIGANSVLARVGAYFHDIGKVTKPGYFTENIRTGDNPHDELTPSMSALLVMAHIKEGVTLAMLHKLPRPVIDIIQQHHGTGLVIYFHHKAERQSGAEPKSAAGRGHTTVDESSYRYPGPKPTSRESAIIMLADSVEAASRSLEKPTPTHIVELVDRLVDAKINDRQLDACEMTLAELCRVKRSFVFSLSNILHTRIAYPKPEEKKG